MTRRRVTRGVLFSCVVVATWACSRRDVSPRVDSASDTARATSSAAAADTHWASELGQLLVVPSDSDNVAVVLYPREPSATLMSGQLTLMNAAGDTTRVKAVVPPDSQQCGDAPVVRLTGAGPVAWSAGLVGRSATLLRMDSIEALPSADSARLAADLARMASALSTHKNSRFSGLPFAVLGARRFETSGRQYVVGHLVRRLSQEAAPLEERTLIIAERAANAAAPEPYVVAHSMRSEGSEDAAEHFEILAAMAGRDSPMLLLARDQLSRTDYEILERSPAGRWTTRWARTLSC